MEESIGMLRITYRWRFEELEHFSEKDWEKCFIILYRIPRRIVGEIKGEK